jgi:transposase InsO family protein
MPMEEISIDLKGPYPETTRGNKWVLVVVDSFTKWMEAYCLPDSEAPTVARALIDGFISRFGVPYWIKTDRGSQLDGKVFNELCRLLEVDHKTSTPFHPQGNAKCERMVKVVGNLISTFCKTMKDWDDRVSLMTLAYRSTVHEVTGYSPNYLMLGREIFLPLDIMIGTLPEEQRKIAPTFVADLRRNLEDSFQDVREALSAYGERQRRYYDLRTRGEELKIGNVVYMMDKNRKKGVAPKLSPRWKGPFLVIQKCGTVYEVQTSQKTSKLAHFDLLKLCHKEELPPWLTRARKRLGSSGD